MKKIILTVAIVATAFVSCKENKKDKTSVAEEVTVTEVQEVKNNVDIKNSVVTWKGSKPTGSHDGTVLLKSGALVVENGNVKAGEFVVDMTSIVCLDLKGTQGASNLEGHLSSPDFFDVPKFPTAKFVVTSSEIKEGKVHVTGNITIKDITKSITIPATVSETDGILTFKSDVFKIDRTDFGITYKSKKLDAAIKDKFINDLMEMSFTVKTSK